MGSGADGKKKGNVKTFNEPEVSKEATRLATQKEEQEKEHVRLCKYEKGLNEANDKLEKDRTALSEERKQFEAMVASGEGPQPETLKEHVEALNKQAEWLLEHEDFVHDGDEHQPLSVAKRTLESVVARLKVTMGHLK